MAFTTFKGKVIEGNKIGRELGFPTANISTSDILPEKGVYVAKIQVKGNFFYGILNIGTRPTLHLTQLSIEVHIFNFVEDIYNQDILITPLHFIRNEMMFDSINGLKMQMEKDKSFTENFISSYNPNN